MQGPLPLVEPEGDKTMELLFDEVDPEIWIITLVAREKALCALDYGDYNNVRSATACFKRRFSCSSCSSPWHRPFSSAPLVWDHIHPAELPAVARLFTDPVLANQISDLGPKPLPPSRS